MLPPYVIGCTARDVTRGSRGTVYIRLYIRLYILTVFLTPNECAFFLSIYHNDGALYCYMYCQYTFLSVERIELDRNYAPSVCDWLYST